MTKDILKRLESWQFMCKVQDSAHSTGHCEILDSYLKQHHQHHILGAHFHAEPQSQAKAYKVDRLFSPNSGIKLTASGVTDSTALFCGAR